MRRVGLLLALLLAVLLVACADDEGNRRFANDPRTPHPTATQAPEAHAPSGPPRAARPQASPEALVDRRGAPDAAYWLDGDTLWAIGDGPPRPVVDTGVLAFAPSPDGLRVAVVTAPSGAYRIDVLAVDGAPEVSFTNVMGAVATPVASPAAAVGASATGKVSLDWSPQGNRLLLADASGALVDVPFDGRITPIQTRVPLANIEEAAWSPRGDTIAVLTRDRDGLGSLALVDPTVQPARVSIAAPVGRRGESDTSVEAFAWKPRGDGIVFLEARRDEGTPANGMVVSWDRATNSTQVLATGGQGGPTGSVTWLSVAPDGKAVAYIVAIPGTGGDAFVGLFVRSMIDGQLYRVPVDAEASPFRAWWLRDGLAWAATVGDNGQQVRLVFIDGRGERRAIGAIGAPAATPVASPVATPAASPAASPAATPVASSSASPRATPAG